MYLTRELLFTSYSCWKMTDFGCLFTIVYQIIEKFQNS